MSVPVKGTPRLLRDIVKAAVTPWRGGASVTTDGAPTVYQMLDHQPKEVLSLHSSGKKLWGVFLKWAGSLTQHLAWCWSLQGPRTVPELMCPYHSPIPSGSLDSGPSWLVLIPPPFPSTLIFHFFDQVHVQSPPGLDSFCSLWNALPLPCPLPFTFTWLIPALSCLP